MVFTVSLKVLLNAALPLATQSHWLAELTSHCLTKVSCLASWPPLELIPGCPQLIDKFEALPPELRSSIGAPRPPDRAPVVVTRPVLPHRAGFHFLFLERRFGARATEILVETTFAKVRRQ